MPTKKKKAWRPAGIRTWVLTATATLSACMVGPNYVRPPADAPAAFKETQGWKNAQPRDAAIRGSWWEVFGDAQLNALEAQVDVSNQTLKAAEARVREARALVQQARARAAASAQAAPHPGCATTTTWRSMRAGSSICGAGSGAISNRAKRARRQAWAISARRSSRRRRNWRRTIGCFACRTRRPAC